MSIITPAVLTTTQIVGGLVASAKNALDLAKASSDHALKSAVSELYDSLLDVKGRVLDLDEENRKLKVQLASKDKIVGPDETNGYFFFKSKPDQPLCPRCYQSIPSNPAFLGPLQDCNGGKRRSCRVCAFYRNETPMNAPTIPNGRRSPWGD